MALLFRRHLACGLILIFAGSPLRAMDEPSSFILDLPFQANQATPIWLGHPETPATTFATLNVPIMPPDTTSSLLVTVFFQEKTGGFLRITWQEPQGGQILSDNLYEGIGMSNQRSLLISPETLAGQGTLNFQCGDTILGIQRIKLEWLQTKGGLVSPRIPDLLVTSASGATQPAQELDGQLRQGDAAAWNGTFVTVPITDTPQRIEMGMEFSVQLDNVPVSARLGLKEAGLPWGKRLAVWINQQRAGTITPAVPDLTNDGYLGDTSSTYVGWRNGSFYVPVSFLKQGVNAVQFSEEDETPAANAAPPAATDVPPLAVKDVVLQFNYSNPAQPDADPAPTPSASSATETNAPTAAVPAPDATNAPSTVTPASPETNAP